MGQEYIESIDRTLTGRLLDIWRGFDDQGEPIDLTDDKRDAYIRVLLGKKEEPVQPVKFRDTGSRKPVARKGCNCGKKNPS